MFYVLNSGFHQIFGLIIILHCLLGQVLLKLLPIIFDCLDTLLNLVLYFRCLMSYTECDFVSIMSYSLNSGTHAAFNLMFYLHGLVTCFSGNLMQVILDVVHGCFDSVLNFSSCTFNFVDTVVEFIRDSRCKIRLPCRRGGTSRRMKMAWC